MIQQWRVVAVLAGLLCSSGCSKEYKYEATGSVSDSVTGKPIKNARIEFQDSYGYRIGTVGFTDELGEFHFVFKGNGGLRASNVRVVIEALNYEVAIINPGGVEFKNRNDVTYLEFNSQLRQTSAAK